MSRKTLFSFLLSFAALFVAGCELDVQPGGTKAAKQSKSGKGQATQFVRSPSGTRLPPQSADTIRIASFNIQVLGQSKLKKPGVPDALARVIRQFDVVAIQELRSKQQNVIPQLLEKVNGDGSRYDSVVGPRQGRTTSKEQYVFLFDSRVIEYVADSAFVVPDRGELLHREPMAASFRVRRASSGTPFSFTLMNIHTDPDETDVELDALDDSYRFVQSRVAPEDDVILLGDLNVSPAKLGELGQLPNITWTVRNEMTNTLRTKSYDNIVFHRYHTNEFTGRSGVFDLEKELGIDRKQALRISDHLPVWAEFSASEAAPVSVARRPR